MPVDNTGKTSVRPRPPRKPVSEEEQKDIELKRLRGELSCAECRRLKLKCDKSVPCGSCVRRGCQSICPCGILSAGQGTRFILADTDQLHAKIAEMSLRIRQLEEALAILQGVVSSERHPLLTTDLLKIKFAAQAPQDPQGAADEHDSALDALGTLTLGDSGEVKYFGRSAGTEVEDNEDDEDSASDSELPLPFDIEDMGSVFPSGHPNAMALERLRTFLPDSCESYIAHAALFFRPIRRDELLNSLLVSVYVPSANDGAPHALSTLFFILALGALLDLQLPPFNAEAERYYGLGRAALGLRAVYHSPLVDTVRAIGLMATYHSLGGKKYSRDSAWCLMSIAAKLAQSVNRDSARWHMDPKTVQKRRNLFWEVFAADVSHSIALGRPPSIHLSYVDSEYPEDEECSLTDLGELRPGFWHSKYRFSRDIWMRLAEVTLTAKSPGYSTVLELDRKVRELSVPDSFKPYATLEDGDEEYYSSSSSLRGFYASQYRTVTMVYIHRSFFAQAMLDHPANPLLSPFATSFLTAYRSASVIIKATAYQFDRCAEMAMRTWYLLHQTFSAAVVAGTVVTLSPKSNRIERPLDLGVALDLFERAAAQSHRARIASGVLRKLKQRAIRSYTQYCSPTLPTASPSTDATGDDDAADELAIFGGHTRVLALKQKYRRPKSASPGDSAPAASVAPSDLGQKPSTMRASSRCSTGTDSQVVEGLPWLDALAPGPSGQEGASALESSANLYSMLYAGASAGSHAGEMVDIAGEMVDIGLASESGMDAAWVSFMQQCGVTLDGISPAATIETEL
ncbi:hypothetical protein C8J57DRAFT_1363463 [Mycena rebaudengoi]|nr:hypothetical protein C8J57DRAFT_1363463 [Mycena rebaudengoi]